MPQKKRTGSCSECKAALYNRNARCCSNGSCRGRRARRLNAIKARRGEAITELNQSRADAEHLATLKLTDEMRSVAREELRPVVREAITEDVLRAAQKLVNLTPLMVDLIEADMRGGDRDRAQKAYSLLARYTLGNTSIAPKPEEAEKAPMQVVFQLPRPGNASVPLAAEPLEIPPADVATEPTRQVELRECNECHEHKPLDQFVGASDRCQTCHDEVQARVSARFPEL